MFCQKCGNPLQPGERFCTKCGAPVEQQAQPQQPQQPQQQYQQPQQQYQPQQAYAPKAPTDKKKLFGLLVSIIFGVAAVFSFVSLIGFCAKYGGGAGMIISFILVILACTGIALAPLFKQYTKLCIASSGLLLFIAIYGISIGGIDGSFGYFVYALGFAALAALCWLAYKKNGLARRLWVVFIPAGAILVGAVLNWIILKYFSVYMKYSVIYPLFDLLFAITMVGGAVILGLYLIETFNDESIQLSIPDPDAKPNAPKAQQPQNPYQR